MRPSLPLLILGIAVSPSQAWTPQPKAKAHVKTAVYREKSFDPLQLCHDSDLKCISNDNKLRSTAAFMGATLPLFSTPDVASAATAFAPNSSAAAVVAYGHYISLVGVVACLVAERLTIKPKMTPEEEDFVAAADIGYGVFGALIVYTGYLRAVQYEKGFDFYAHEPLFWLKIAFIGIWGASSFFNTITIIRRAVDKRNGKFEPMGEKLAKRMIQICNAELVAVGIIPLTATFMARGVGYNQEIPWQAEAGFAALIFAGASFKYVKEAFSFEDNVNNTEPSD